MLKRLAMLAFLILAITHGLAQLQQSPSPPQSQSGNQKAPAPLPRSDTNAASSQWWKSPEWWLFILGIPSLVALLWQAQQTKLAAIATKIAAEAALKNAQAVIDAERPWMMIETNYQRVLDYPMYTFRFVNRGRSPAEIVNTYSEFRTVPVLEADDLPSQPNYGKFAAPEWEVVHHHWYIPGEGFEIYSFDCRVIGEMDPDRWKAIQGLKIRLYFIGVVRYRDTLSAEIHESRFCYVAGSHALLPFGPTSAYNKLT
jgi:hypothetical protein